VLDDLLAHLVGEAAFGRLSASRRAKLIARLFFGLLGAGLGAAGAIYMLRNPPATGNLPMVASMIAMFVSLGAFFLFNVAMARPWKWPGLAFVASFVAMFVARIALGR
jgi:hypothetical protein